MERNLIVVGDATSGGGQVIGGTPFTHIDGQPIARVGDQATCPRHRGTFPIITGDATLIIDGQPVAREGDLLACGCALMSVRQRSVFTEAEDLARNPAPATHARPVPATPPANAGTPALQAAEALPSSGQPPTTVTLRIGVFFDGTNNNAANVALGGQCRASTAQAQGQDAEERAAIVEHCRPYMLRAGGSYDNGVSNVARLYGLYRDNLEISPEQDAEDFTLRVYVEGIGTTAGAPDNLLSQGLGGGRMGVLAKLEQVFQQLIPRQLEAFVVNAADTQVSGVEFDVFGFSRGAAAARHFVRQVNLKGIGPLGKALLHSGVRYAPGFGFADDVRVGFVGLFDTVVAIGSLADGLDVRDGRDGGVDVALPTGCARQVVQLAARDERRANFLLTTVAPPHREMVLPGAHSDVGGGYHRDREGPLLLEKPAGFIEPHAGLAPGQQPDPAWLQRSRAHGEAQAACDRWREFLGLGPEAVKVEVWHRWQHRRRAGSDSALPDTVLRVYAAAVLERPLDWRYQLVPLRVMHELAREAGAPFKSIPDEPDFALPSELEPIAAKLLAGQSLDEGEEALLRRKYLHQSSHWNFALGERLGGGPVSWDIVYVNRPDPGGRRGIRPNQ
ncbi:PAAR domain-containing protein [Pseudoxanthomonas mexicana]|uniref:PAAR domain-containing protein n=1 Tax=Pseudoxanthomonas mexicana TaxID=128785 RepID=UPI00398ACBB4